MTNRVRPRLVCNIRAENAGIFRQAAKNIGIDVTVDDEAFDILGRPLPGMNSVWTTESSGRRTTAFFDECQRLTEERDRKEAQ